MSGNNKAHQLIHFAEYYQQKGDMRHAAELTGLLGKPLASLDDNPGWTGTVHYNVACSLALLGKKDEALSELKQALKLAPQLVAWSKEDPDLDSLRENSAYKALYKDSD